MKLSYYDPKTVLPIRIIRGSNGIIIQLDQSKVYNTIEHGEHIVLTYPEACKFHDEIQDIIEEDYLKLPL